VDDVLNVSGHRSVPPKWKARCVAPLGGRGCRGRLSARHQRPGIYCYVTLKVGIEPTEALRKELVQQCARRSAQPPVRRDPVGAGPAQDRSGKIMRASCARSRPTSWTIWRHVDAADPAVVDDLVKNRAHQ